MSYLTKQAVLAAIKPRIQHYKDEKHILFEAYFGISPITKKPVRKASKSIEKLKRIVEDFYKHLSKGGDYAVILTPYQSVDARNALDLLSKAKIDLSLSECVRRFIEDNGDKEESTLVTLADAYSTYTKSQSDKSVFHLKAIKARVGRWVHLFGGDRLVSEVTPQEVVKDLENRFIEAGNPSSKTTYNNHLNYIKTFMAWCAAPEQGYISASPLITLKPKEREYVDPEYMKPNEVEKMFRVLEKRGGSDLANAILSFFCGMRQEEIRRIEEGERAIVIDIEEKYIRIIKCKGHTRGIKPRAFTIPEQALAWMKAMPNFMEEVRKPNRRFREHLNEIAKEAGVSLPKNAGRHTFCTMFEAAHHDSNALSAIVGNTEDIRDRHYNGVAKPQEGRDYFAIMPSRKDGAVTSQASSARAPEA